MTPRIIAFLPMAYFGTGPGYTAASIARSMCHLGTDELFVCAWELRPLPKPISSWPATGLPLPYGLIKRARLLPFAVRRAERQVLALLERRQGPKCLHLWPGASPGFAAAAKSRGATVFREMVNTHVGTARRILDAESARTGVPANHRIDDAWVSAETAELNLCDFVFSPSEGVDASLQEHGIPEGKIVRTSFGWDPQRFPPASPRVANDPKKPVTALFVGRLSIRKGVHLALEAWAEAAIEGRFVLVGAVDPDLRPILERHLASGTVEHHDFTDDVAAFYRDADFLLFPTLEEGAPLICYEAFGCGLPIVTTPMGTARIVKHGETGLVFEAHDRDDFVSAIRAMNDPALRARLSNEAGRTAKRYTWQDAARERIEAFHRFSA